MPNFQPPTEDTVSPVYLAPDKYYPVPPLSQKLFRHYGSRTKGRNVWKLTNGTYTEVQPLDPDTVAVIYHGGHIYVVSDAEATALTAAGYTVG